MSKTLVLCPSWLCPPTALRIRFPFTCVPYVYVLDDEERQQQLVCTNSVVLPFPHRRYSQRLCCDAASPLRRGPAAGSAIHEMRNRFCAQCQSCSESIPSVLPVTTNGKTSALESGKSTCPKNDQPQVKPTKK